MFIPKETIEGDQGIIERGHMTQKNVGVIIPAYNVAQHIEKVVRTIPCFVQKIIVVDDGSNDDTVYKVESIKSDRLVLIRHEHNQGVGAAMLTGYKKAAELEMDIMVKMDGDGQMKPEYLEALIYPLISRKAHYSKGNRFTDYRTLQKMPVLRRAGNTALSFFTKMVSGYWNTFDVTNGYTAILTETFDKLDLEDIGRNYFFEISMLVELNIVGACVADVDMPSVYEEEKSHLNPGLVILLFPFTMGRAFFRRFYRRYIVRDFGILSICALFGLVLFLSGIFYGLRIWITPPYPGEPTPAGTVMLAALPIILGFQLLLTALILDVVFVPYRRPTLKKDSSKIK